MKIQERRQPETPRLREAMLVLCVALVCPHPIAPALIEVSGSCTLADAVASANSDTAVGGCATGSGADTIALTQTAVLDSIAVMDEGENGLPTVTSEVTIDGGGFSIQRDAAGPQFRILKVDTVGILTLDDVTLSYGHVGTSVPRVDQDGGAILSRGSLYLLNSTISYSRASRFGGGIASFGTALLDNSTVTQNDAPYGGGVYNYGAMAVLGSTVSFNSAYGYFGAGGGFLNHSSGDLTISKSTLNNNTASRDYASGGAVDNSGELVIFNSTMSDNVASYGGAIAGGGTIVNSTFYANDTNPDSAPYSSALSGALTLYGTILNNYDGFDTRNCSGTVTDLGNNFVDDASCGSIPKSMPGLDPVLADNGGPTRTHALLEGSIAIDSGQDCPAATDQRGVPRNDGACDSGAFELFCSAAQGNDEVLEAGSTASEETVETCTSITVRDWVVFGPDGHLILRTAGTVKLEDGLEVGVDGRLTVENDDTILLGSDRPRG